MIDSYKITHFTVNSKSVVRKCLRLSQIEENLNKTGASSLGIALNSTENTDTNKLLLELSFWEYLYVAEGLFFLQNRQRFPVRQLLKRDLLCSCVLITCAATQGNIIVSPSQLTRRD